MLDLGAAYGEVVESLEALGLRAIEDPRDLNPPCILVRDASVAPAYIGLAWEVVWQLDIVVGDAGTRANLAALSRVLAVLTDALPIDSATRLDLILLGSPGPAAGVSLSRHHAFQPSHGGLEMTVLVQQGFRPRDPRALGEVGTAWSTTPVQAHRRPRSPCWTRRRTTT